MFNNKRITYAGEIIDMHCHVLPGVDDGAKDLEQSMCMLAIAAFEGVTTVVATPHLVCDGTEKQYLSGIKDAFDRLTESLIEAEITVNVVLGCELLLSPSLVHFTGLPGCAIAGTNLLLVEPPVSEPPDELDELLYRLDHIGMGLILAHPERNHWLSRNHGHLEELAQRGVLMQVNAGSVVGKWGGAALRCVRRMADRGIVHFVGSDAHSDCARGPAIRAAVGVLAGWVGEVAASEIAFGRPEKILNEVKTDERTRPAYGVL